VVDSLTKIAVTKFMVAKKRGRRPGSYYASPRIYLPTKLVSDSAFPFSDGESLVVRIIGRKLVVKKTRRRESETFEPSLREPL